MRTNRNSAKLLATVTAMATLPLTAASAWATGTLPTTASAAITRNNKAKAEDYHRVTYHTAVIEGLNIFYREAGNPAKPTILLLHGFPSSSHMFRNLIPALANDYHIIAPDYPGYGYSSMPTVDKFEYTFDHLTTIVEKLTQTLNLTRYSLYVQDYGAPVGFRLAARHPEAIQAIITQNGNAYEEGLTTFWGAFRNLYWKDPSAKNAETLTAFLKPEGTKGQYTTGVHDVSNINPDSWTSDQVGLDRPGNTEIQLALFYDYRKNPPLYAKWHEYFRQYQPATLIVWGKNDPIFAPEGAKAFQRDLKNTELHLLDTGHFALEEEGDQIAAYIREFLRKNVK